jgi:hypothetical protein
VAEVTADLKPVVVVLLAAFLVPLALWLLNWWLGREDGVKP